MSRRLTASSRTEIRSDCYFFLAFFLVLFLAAFLAAFFLATLRPPKKSQTSFSVIE
jgi:predicted permease